MDIPAQKICEQLDVQLAKLKDAVSNQDKQTISESVAVIEAYCQLLKGSQSTAITQQQQASRQQTYSQPQQLPYSEPQQPVTNVEQEVKGRNLLEF
ncbi:DUF5327 family protein [Halalkalibacter krulwichiae]|uniref:Uncharacterized protein n=1 Tax=Halalkalibacter krulwichiae TaxID=199441 RepID=A0A1X9MHA2_9BACI|nr:DUF5327 family protein [Halalkalibacter krulwichiae]ARK32818.1 hypothetical protein BkAM31D_24770 [Halalkalibacter krulwichiae]